MKKHNFLLRALCRCMTGGVLFCIVIYLCSCENFLDGAEVKKNLNDAINYINAENCLIGVDFVDGSGVLNKPAGGETEKKEGEYFSLDFDVSDKYEFIRWEIKDSVSGKVYENGEYIGIDDVYSSDTECCFIKCPPAGVRLTLTSVLAVRPKVIDYSPKTNTTSPEVVKDVPVQVMFDHEMHSDSLYYDNDELAALRGDDEVGPKNILWTIVDGEVKYYGHKKNGETFFKALRIESTTGENLCSCFNPPVFDTKRIVSVTANTDSSKGNILEDYTNVYVTVKSVFFYKEGGKEDGKNVLMANPVEWTYQVNDAVDSDGPEINKIAFSSTKSGTFEEESSAPSLSSIADFNYLDEGVMHVKMKVFDFEAGPSPYFILTLTKLFDSDYAEASGTVKRTVYFESATPQTGYIDADIDFDSDELKLSDGVYSMEVTVSDRTGKTASWPSAGKKIYFCKDTTPLDIEPSFDVSETSGGYKIAWDKQPQETDYKETVLEVKNLQYGTVNEYSASSSCTFTAQSGTEYETNVIFSDYAGRKTVKNIKILKSIALSGAPSFVVKDVFHKDSTADYYDTLKVTALYLDGTTADVTDRAFVADSYRNTKASVIFKYTQSLISKTAVQEGEYYVARKLYDRPYLDGVSYYLFGDFPSDESTVVTSSSLTAEPVYHGWYLDASGQYYARKVITVDSQPEVHWYKVMPVKWRDLGLYEGARFMVADSAVVTGIPFYGTQQSRYLKGKEIKSNDWKYSNIRAFLNSKPNQYVTDGGTAGEYDLDWSVAQTQVNEKHDSEEYVYEYEWTEGGFLTTAFTPKAYKKYLQEVKLDNSLSSMKYKIDIFEHYQATHVQLTGTPEYSQDLYDNESTYDRVFLLSIAEATENVISGCAFAYANVSDTSDIGEYGRKRQTTGFSLWLPYDDLYKTRWYLRSPFYSSNKDSVACISPYGKFINYSSSTMVPVCSEVTEESTGIVPCICVDLSGSGE